MSSGKEAKMPTPLLFPWIAWTIGILSGFTLSYLFNFSNQFNFTLSILAIFSFVFIAFFVFRKEWGKNIALLILILIIAVARSYFSTILPPNHISNIVEKESSLAKNIEFTVVSEPVKYKDSYYFKGEMNKIEEREVNGLFITFIPERNLIGNVDSLVRGAKGAVFAELTLQEPKFGFLKTPEPIFNSKKYPKVRVYSKGVVTLEKPERITPTNWYKAHLSSLKKTIINRIESRFNYEEAGFIKAVLLGSKEDLGELRDLIDRGGMSHLLAISGLHLALLTFLVSIVLKTLGIRRTPLWSILIIFLLFYGELCQWSPSISRAVVMLILLLIAKILQRKVNPNNLLAATFIIITAIEPVQIFSVGLQLSLLSVWTLMNVIPYYDQLLKAFFSLDKDEGKVKLQDKLFYNASKLLIVSFFLGVILTPLVMVYFHRCSLNGIIGNMLSIPLLELLLPLAVLLILLPSFLGVIMIYHNAFSVIFSLFEKWAYLTAHLPFFYDFIRFNWLNTVLSYALLFSLWMQVKHRRLTKIDTQEEHSVNNKAEHTNHTRRHKKYLVASSVLLVLLLISLIPINNGKLRITYYNVDHGDLFLIETPQRERIMIDTGPGNDQIGHFKKSVLPNLRGRGIQEIDWLIITHPHKDHHGGFKSVSKNIKIKNLMVNEFFTKSDVWDEYHKLAAERNINTIVIQDTTSIQFKKLHLKIIHPDKNFYTDNINDNSIVVKLTYDGFSALFTGDIEVAAENYLVHNYEVFLDSDMLKVAHHGSITSTTSDFLEKVSPDYAVISVESKGKDKNPHPRTLEALKYLEDRLLLTSKDGTVTVLTDGLDIRITTSDSKRKIIRPLITGPPAAATH